MIWPIIAFFLLRYYGVDSKIFVLLSIVWMLYLSVRNNNVLIIIPKISGFGYYVAFIIIATLIGLVQYGMRDIVKDIYYITPTVFLMAIGYLYTMYNPEKSITKTFYVAGVIITILSLVSLVDNMASLQDFRDIRRIMGKQVYEVSLIAAMMLVEKIIGKKVIFSIKTDWIIFVVLSIKSLTSFGRTELISSIVMVFTTLFLTVFMSEQKAKGFLKMLAITGGIIALLFAIYHVMPNSAVSQFIEKLEYSMEEVDTSAGYSSTEDAMQHWRAYEAESAVAQWKKNNLITQIFGEGFGRYIYIHYIPHDFNDRMVVNHSIALLHNTYYSLLVKGGLMGVSAIIWLYLSNIIMLFRVRDRKYRCDLCIIFVLTIGMAIMTYVVRGIFTQSPVLVWPFMVGSVNYIVRNDIRSKHTLTGNEG